MPNVDPSLLRVNSILATLPLPDREAVGRRCEEAALEFGETICKPGDVIRHVYFPTTGYISLIAPAGLAESVEVGMVGDEGMFGATVLLDVNSSPLQALVQGGGVALRMTVRRFKTAVNEIPSFRLAVNRYLFVLTAQLAQTAACNRFHLLDARMARWLLMTQDRAHGPTFRLTHKFLAYMLGVMRPGVTEAAGRLQAKGMIRYTRGEITVVNRRALEAIACPCYTVFTKTYMNRLATTGKVGDSTPPRVQADATGSE